MKRIISIILSVVILIAGVNISVHADANNISFIINGEKFSGYTEVINGQTFVCLNDIKDMLDLKVNWNKSEGRAFISRGENTIDFTTGKNIATANGRAQILTEPCYLHDKQIMVPLRLMCETLGADVEYNSEKKEVSVTDYVKTLAFDNLSNFESPKDYETYGNYDSKNVSLTDEFDHTTGDGKSLKLSNIDNVQNKLFLQDFFSPKYLGDTFTISLWAYIPEGATNIRWGAGTTSDGKYASQPAISDSKAAKVGEWTNFCLEYVHERDYVTTVYIDFLGGQTHCGTVYIDDVEVKKNVYKKNITSTVNHRPVPTAFEASNSYDDIIYYDRFEHDNLSNEEKLSLIEREKTVVDSKPLLTANVVGGEANKVFGDFEVVAVKDMPFTRAKRVNCVKTPGSVWQFQMLPDLSGASSQFKSGDFGMISLCMRTVEGGLAETGEGQITLNFGYKNVQKAIFSETFSAGNEWTYAYFPFQVDEQVESNQFNLAIYVGNMVQVIDIADFKLDNYGSKITAEDFPIAGKYDGIKSDAQWRKEALDRIEKVRKSDMHIIVKDEAGNVVPDAEITVNMLEHEFHIGSVISQILASADNRFVNYQSMRSNAVKYFNGGVHESATKWESWLSPGVAEKVKESNKWLKEHGVVNLRGHVLLIDAAKPAFLEEIIDDRAALEKTFKEAFYDRMKSTEGDFICWDVVNEEIRFFDRLNGAFTSRYGSEMLLDWYRWAHEILPDCPLFINDVAITGKENGLDSLKRYIDFLLDNDIPLGGIGIEGHGAFASVHRINTELEELSKYNLPITITEYDTPISDQELYASKTRDYIISAFSYENVDGFYVWGMSDGNHWLKNSAFADLNWEIKPSGEQIVDLFYNKFWTRDSGVANDNGEYSLRGFNGFYEITAYKDGKSGTYEASLSKNSDNVFEVIIK